MDTIIQINEEVTKLKTLRDNLTAQIDQLQHESYEVKDQSFGIGNRANDLLTKIMRLNPMINGIIGKKLEQSLNQDFDSAQDYVDHIADTISQIHDYISKVDQVIANLEKCRNDLEYQLRSVNIWLAKSTELLA